MFVDARILQEPALAADICIAGAGAAGMTLALDLRDSGLSVILLESGGFRREPEPQRLSDGRMTGIDTWSLRSMRIRALGGATGHWEGWCRPLMPQDLQVRDWVPNSGWPIRYLDLIPWYRQASDTLELGAFDWDARVRAKAMGKTLLPAAGALENRYYQFSPPTRFGRVYGGVLEKAERVRVLEHATVTDIELDEAAQHVSAFICRTPAKNQFSVRARRYVLALGGIENARVLLASHAQIEGGVANRSGAVGRYFMEHPHYYSAIGMVHSSALDLSFYTRTPSDLKRRSGTPVRVLGAVGLTAETMRRERLLNFSATLQAASASAETGSIAAADVQQLVTRGSGAFRAAELSLRAEQSPQPDSRITLTDELDALGVPRIALDWRLADEDRAAMARGLAVLARELGASGAGRMWIPGDPDRFEWKIAGGGHHMGTTRMGSDPAASVVNADCRTHDVENLFIAGSSVFPTGGEANPTLTIVALAHRLAARLKGLA
jgi:choline dehydrogenase-like flavoprotein